MDKKIGIEPTVIAEDCGVTLLTGYTGRAYKLDHGDVVFLNDAAARQTFNMSIKGIKIGAELQYGLHCIHKIKRRHWWQFWKPKYTGARFIYIEKENGNDTT